MHLKSCVLALTGVSLITATFTRCGTSDPREDQLQVARLELQAIEKNMTRPDDYPTKIDINVHFHVITNPRGLQDGQLSSDQLSRQLNVLNNAFNTINITFNLTSIDTFEPEQWYGGCQGEHEWERLWLKVRLGNYADLNVFFVPNIFCVLTNRFLHRTGVGRAGGFVYDYPTNAHSVALSHEFDGVTISADTVPGGSEYRFNKGMTLVHEVGHWLGLFHTFHGGYTGDGDLIDDTPAESEISTSCEHPKSYPYIRNSCPYSEGTDPVANYMDYSEDSCLTEFTPGQVRRMYDQWYIHRADYQKPTHTRRNSTISALNFTAPHTEGK